MTKPIEQYYNNVSCYTVWLHFIAIGIRIQMEYMLIANVGLIVILYYICNYNDAMMNKKKLEYRMHLVWNAPIKNKHSHSLIKK